MSVDGNWKITMNTPMGAQQLQLSVASSGATFSGTVNGAMGEDSVSGTVDGNALAWSSKITQPMPMTLEFTATVDGDAMSGSVKLGSFGNAPLTGERVPA